VLVLPIGLVLAVTVAVAAATEDQPWQPLSEAVPDQYAGAIQLAAAACPGLPAAALAAQLATESSWDPTAVSPAGAQGLAQFLPGTWATWGRDADGDGRADPFDPLDAIAAQGALMCHLLETARRSGWGEPIDLALAGYNAGWGAVTRYRGIPPYPETSDYVAKVRALARRYEVSDAEPSADTSSRANRGDVDALLPAGYRNGRSSEAAVAWALSQVGAWRDIGYCLRFVGRGAYQRPWDGAGIDHATNVWDNAPPSLRHPGSYAAPRGAILLWSRAIGGGSGHIAISLGDGRMVTTTSGAVAIRAARGFAPAAYLGWMPPYFRSH
jgi:hypothetical protein